MKRFAIEKLIRWAHKSDANPLVIRGARQVGKTTLVRMLAKQLAFQLIEVNMETRPSFIPLLQDKSQAKTTLEGLLIEHNINSDAQNVLFFFDEAQETPGLYSYLRYFKELAPQYKVVIAGSLFEFELVNNHHSQGPTGRVEFAYLEPMTYSEFLLAANAQAYNQYETLDPHTPVPPILHELLTKYYKEYLLCGGMPRAVKSWLTDKSALNVDEIKSDIVQGYISDLPKYSELDRSRYDPVLLTHLFNVITSRPANGQKYVEFAPEYRSEKVKAHLAVLHTARVIRQSVHTSQVQPPLLLGANTKRYKYFALDVGLTYTLLGLPISELYAASDINGIANGIIAEQFVAQTLASLPPYHKRHALYHWERTAKNAQAEVDFMLALNGQVIPVECKSGVSKKIRSLRVLLAEQPFALALRLYSGNVSTETIVNHHNGKDVKTTLLSLPHYLLERFVACNSELLD